MSSAQVNLIGNVGQDAETKDTSNGNKMLKFSIAVSRKDRQTGEDVTVWYRVTAFGRDAEFHSGIAKGDKVYVSGRLEPSIYIPDNGGAPKLNMDVTATAIENCTPRAHRPVEDVEEPLPF